MALAGGWFDVIGARGFIFLALRAGHNATFVTIGGMRAAVPRMRSEQFAASGWEIAIASASASRWKSVQSRLRNFGTKPSAVTCSVATTNRNCVGGEVKNRGGPIAKRKRAVLHGPRPPRDRHGAGSSLMRADGGPRRAKRCPACYQRPDLTGFSGQFLRTKPVAREPNFGNSAKELQFAIEACRTSAGFCYE